MKLILTFGLVLVLFLPAGAQTSQRLIIAGDAGKDILALMQRQLNPDSNSIFIFLGNDLLGDDTASFRHQLSFITELNARAFFVPGNEEWANGRTYGLQTLLDREKTVKALGNERIRFLPGNGCPGPVNVPAGKDAELIIMDSQWWLHEHEKPEVESDCKQRTRMQVLDELADQVSDHRSKLVVFFTHHPLRSTGVRSGYFGLKQHIFPLTDIRGLRKLYLPLPILGSLYPVSRGVLVSRQDMTHARYQDMVASVDDVLRDHPFLIRVAGHEPIMEVFREDERYYLVSGSGARAGRAQRTPQTLYAAAKRGFTVLEITEDRDVKAIFYEIDNNEARIGYQNNLFNFSTQPPIAPDTTTLANISTDSFTAPVNIGYSRVSSFKKWLNGENYRDEWAAPVSLKVFRIGQEKGGLTIKGQGGGKQTTTIRLDDSSGKSWALRSINKDPVKIIPENFRNSFARDIVQDMLSASHPYSARPAAALAKAMDIAAPETEYYFVPNDTALGHYRPFFANTVVMLEERDPSLYGEETHSTWNLFNRRLDKFGIETDQQSYLKARMLDIILADFDRHYEQFKWGERKEHGKTVYYTVPKDRDQAFFYSDGALMPLFAYSRMPFLKGLRSDIPAIHWYGFVARDVDGLFLNQLTRSDWENTLNAAKAGLTDQEIEDAVRQMPPEVYAIRGAAVTDKLKSRRDLLPERGIAYYDFLARNVNIPGTNNGETFAVTQAPEGLSVEVVQRDSNGASSTIYRRVFDEGETREVRLYGLNGNDSFRIDESVASRIKIRMIGGKGNDLFDIHGKARNLVYDAAAEDNQILHRSRTTNMISHRKDVNSYSFRENTYNSIKIPTINLGFNIEDQFFAGLGFSITRQGFREEPFGSQHRFISLFSFVNKAYQLRYDGEIIDFFRHYDLLLNASFVNPYLNNFFGFGNETVKDTSRKLSYYRVRFSGVSGDVAIRKRFLYNKLGISLGPSFFYYWNKPERNSGRILSNPSDAGLDSVDVYTAKMYGGGRLAIEFNTIDNDLLPTRGVGWTASYTQLADMNGSGFPLSKLQSNLSVYAPLSSNKRFTFVLNAGGGHIFTDKVEYFQALTLGAHNYLRGYRKNRFAGSSMAYTSVELRMKLFEMRSKFLAGNFGLVGFNDLGRVWMRNERSDKWHNAYGGGFYITPFNLLMLSALIAQSEEETLFNISVGTRLNITF